MLPCHNNSPTLLTRALCKSFQSPSAPIHFNNAVSFLPRPQIIEAGSNGQFRCCFWFYTPSYPPVRFSTRFVFIQKSSHHYSYPQFWAPRHLTMACPPSPGHKYIKTDSNGSCSLIHKTFYFAAPTLPRRDLHW